MTKHHIRMGIGILLGVLFTFLAVRRVDLAQMWQALQEANYWLLLPTLPIAFLSHFLRALRWRYLLDPIKRLDLGSLFSSLIIGYMGNVLMPAHLGETLRAYVLSKKRSISASTIFATIVTERLIDVFTLLALMIVTVSIHPFPKWVAHSGYIMSAGALGFFAFLIFLKKRPSPVRALFCLVLRPFSVRFQKKTGEVLDRFISGIVPLKHWSDYAMVALLSLPIWICYGVIFHFSLYAFGFVQAFDLPWSVSLILLVVTTIGVVVPSSPGYVGTYHYLCQVSLAMFGIPASPALSFAAVVHGINFLPLLVVGLFLSYHEGIAISRVSDRVAMSEA
jgi:uncharacterized protein (TIRG00374 family)